MPAVPATSLFWSLGLLGIIICAIAVAALVIPMFRADRPDLPEDDSDD